MYADQRFQASTPEHWDTVFMPQRSFTLNRIYLAIFALNRNLFDEQWHEIRRRVKRGSRILDAGCGMGQWVSFLRERGMDALGLDYSETMVKTLKVRYPDYEWLQGRIQEIPLPDASVDSIVSWGVIEHDEAGPQRALREFYRILRPGGSLFVTVPYDSPAMRRSSEIQTAAAIQNVPGATTSFYQYFMSPQELDCHLVETGFTVEKAVPTTRHYAVLFPNTYLRLQRFGQIGDSILAQVLRPLLMVRQDSCCMVLGVAKKPA